MQTYIRTKFIQAEPMNRKTFEETIKRPGTRYEAVNEDGYHVRYPDGVDSWFPSDVFEQAYRPISEFDRGLIEGT